MSHQWIRDAAGHLAATQHDRLVDADYAMMKTMGIGTVRDALRWPLIETNGTFTSPRSHRCWPQPRNTASRFWTYATTAGRRTSTRWRRSFRRASRDLLAPRPVTSRATPAACPFTRRSTEVSFLSWAAGEVGWFSPFAKQRGGELKRNLVRAVVAACDAIWTEDRRARIVHVDPVIHVMAPLTRPDLTAAAEQQRASQFEAWDMIAGIKDPQLGGHPRYLDVMGVNYYHSNQWEFPDQRLRWEDTPRDPRWVPFHKLLAELYDRYRRPLFVGETSHFGAPAALRGFVRSPRSYGMPTGWASHLRAYASFQSLIGTTGKTPITGTTVVCGIWCAVRTAAFSGCSTTIYAEEVRRSHALLARCGWEYSPDFVVDARRG